MTGDWSGGIPDAEVTRSPYQLNRRCCIAMMMCDFSL